MSVAYDVPPRARRPERPGPAAVLSLAPRVDADEVESGPGAPSLEASATGRDSVVSRPDAPESSARTQVSAQALWVAAPLAEPAVGGGAGPTLLRETPVAVAPALLLLPPGRRPDPDGPAGLSVDAGPFEAAIGTTLLWVEPVEPMVLDIDVESDVDFEPVRRRPEPRPYVAPARTRPAHGVRLTVRGRRVVAAVSALALMAAVFITAMAVRSALTRPLVPASAPAAVTVHPGDTLWSIAQRIAPQSDPRAVVAALRERNHLASSTVRVGQHLHVPH